MNLTKFLCGTAFASSSWFIGNKVNAAPITDLKKDSIEIKNDTIPLQQNDTIISLADSISSDSLILAKKEANYANAEKLMFYLIANYEGFKSQAYRLSYIQNGKRVREKFYTYNLGNTITAEGNKVKSTDRITSTDESYDCYDAFMKTSTPQNPVPLKDAMMLSLPIDKMEDFEIAVMAEIGYNYGPGLLVNKKTKQPTGFAKLASTYFNDRTPENLDKFGKSFLAHCTANGKKLPSLEERRKISLSILKGDIIIYVNDSVFSELPPEKQSKAVNLKTNILGVLNGSHGNNDIIQKRLESGQYACGSGDSIQHAIDTDLNKRQRYPQKGKPQTRKTNLAQYVKQKKIAQR